MRGHLRSLVGTLFLLAALPALGADVPAEGRLLRLRAKVAKPESRRARVVLRDTAITAPFPDPTQGSLLVLSGGAASGQCFVEIPLDNGAWTAIRNDGANRGYVYKANKPGTQGVRKLILKNGRIVVVAKGSGWPCDLSANAQRAPVAVELRVDDTRYCAEFGGSVDKNEQGRLIAKNAAAPAACAKQDLTVANLNLLHGFLCAPDNCRRVDRIDLFFQWVAAAGCPDVVTLQEIASPMVALLDAQLATVCPFAYQRAYELTNTLDDEYLLSRYPIVEFAVTPLFFDFRNVLSARIDHPLGPVDVFSTHLASSADNGDAPCGPSPPCPLECVSAGAANRRDCQAVQAALLVESLHDVSTPAVVTGDFNAEPNSYIYDQFAGRGWSDSHLAAGNPECDAVTGIGCTSGRASDVSELESTVSNVDERIDFIFVVPPGVRSCTIEPVGDGDADGTTTQIFADDPNPFASCGPLPDPVCWASDHEGNELDLNCE